MRWSENKKWRLAASLLTVLGIVVIVAFAVWGRPVLAAYGLSAMLTCLGLYRLVDRQPNAWLAVRSWQKDCFILFLLALLVFLLAPYGGVLMPVSV